MHLFAALQQKHAHDMEQGVEYEPGLKPQEPNIQRSSIANIQATAGTGEYLNKVEDKRAIKVGSTCCCFGSFSEVFQAGNTVCKASMTDDDQFSGDSWLHDVS